MSSNLSHIQAQNVSRDSATLLTTRIRNFARLLCANDFNPGPQGLLDALSTAEHGYLRDRQLFQSALKSCFCQNQRDWHHFDPLFDLYWQPLPEASSELEDRGEDSKMGEVLEGSPAASASGASNLVGFAGTSSQQMEEEVAGAGDYKALSLADFRFVFNPAEMLAIENMVDDLARRCRRSFKRRTVISSHGQTIDLRRSLANAPRHAGLIVDLKFRRRKHKLPQFVLLLDVSQSMEVYSKLFMRFARKILSVFQQSELYAFNVELVSLGSGHQNLSEAEFEEILNIQTSSWLGGTKIGRSLKCFNEDHAADILSKQTVVAIFSDGCDTDAAEDLARQVQKIQARCKRLIWINPLLGRFTYSEKDPNMDPVVPFVDRYRSAHNLQSLEKLQRDFIA